MHLLRKLVLALLLIALPLQGLAASFQVMACSNEHAAAMHQAHEDHEEHHTQAAATDHHAASQQNHDHDQSDDTNGHSCCHNVSTGAAPAATPQAPEAPRAITPRVSLLNTLFIPELPQRPPRA